MAPDALYAQISEWDNLCLAYRNASRGKRGKVEVARYELRLGDELIQLQAELRAHTYQPGAYESFHIHEPKRRLISAAPFRDRVAHHALCNVCVPHFERQFHPHSYANRAGKGTHAALDHCQRLARRFRHVLPCDVRQYFPSIDHAFLGRALARLLPSSPATLGMIRRILDSGRGVLSGQPDPPYERQRRDLISGTRTAGVNTWGRGTMRGRGPGPMAQAGMGRAFGPVHTGSVPSA